MEWSILEERKSARREKRNEEFILLVGLLREKSNMFQEYDL